MNVPPATGVALSHIIYASTASQDLDESDLAHLLLRARQTNAALGVTGMLLYADGSFLQVLEGAERSIKELYAHIKTDPRHRGVTCIIEEPIARRAFADWSMGYCETSASELNRLQNLGGLPYTSSSFLDLPPGRARRLLSAFAEGRWRAAKRAS